MWNSRVYMYTCESLMYHLLWKILLQRDLSQHQHFHCYSICNNTVHIYTRVYACFVSCKISAAFCTINLFNMANSSTTCKFSMSAQICQAVKQSYTVAKNRCHFFQITLNFPAFNMPATLHMLVGWTEYSEKHSWSGYTIYGPMGHHKWPKREGKYCFPTENTIPTCFAST